MGRGIAARSLGPLLEDRGCTTSAKMGVPWLCEVTTVAGTSSYTLIEDAPKDFRVVYAWGVMTGAGAASDTVKITDGTNDISETADLSVFADKEVFDMSEIDDARSDVAKHGKLAVTTASGATCRLYVMGMWRE